MNSCKAMKRRHSQEVSALPIKFAFSDKQFIEGMAELGLSPSDTDKVYSLSGTGGFYLRGDSSLISKTFDRHFMELQEAISSDTTGNGFIYEMFLHELGNHEYGYTGDLTDTLEALCLEPSDFEKSRPLREGLNRAMKRVRKESRP